MQCLKWGWDAESHKINTQQLHNVLDGYLDVPTMLASKKKLLLMLIGEYSGDLKLSRRNPATSKYTYVCYNPWSSASLHQDTLQPWAILPFSPSFAPLLIMTRLPSTTTILLTSCQMVSWGLSLHSSTQPQLPSSATSQRSCHACSQFGLIYFIFIFLTYPSLLHCPGLAPLSLPQINIAHSLSKPYLPWHTSS